MSPEEIAEFVAKSRAEQGLPRRVEDLAVIQRVAALLLPAGEQDVEAS